MFSGAIENLFFVSIIKRKQSEYAKEQFGSATNPAFGCIEPMGELHVPVIVYLIGSLVMSIYICQKGK